MFFYVPVVSKTLVRNVKTTALTQNLKRILWRNATVPSDRIWNIMRENVIHLSQLKFTLLSWLTYLLVVSPFDSEHVAEEWLSGPFFSRSAIFTFSYCWWLACFWLAEIGGKFASNLCTAVNFQKDVRISKLLFQVVLHEGYYWRKQKNGAHFAEGPKYSSINWRVCQSSDRF